MRKNIYLTFDDAPLNGTRNCIQTCKELEVAATFFVVGQHIINKEKISLVNFIRDSYPKTLLANHSFSHANEKYIEFYANSDAAVEDFIKVQNEFTIPYKIVRLPGNAAWSISNKTKASKLVANVCNKLATINYNIIGWDIEWSFQRNGKYSLIQSPEKLASEIAFLLANNKCFTNNNLVLLMHDVMFQTTENTESLFQFISLLKEKREYNFLTVDKYPGIQLS